MFPLSLHGFSYPALSRFKSIHVRLAVDFKLDIGVVCISAMIDW